MLAPFRTEVDLSDGARVVVAVPLARRLEPPPGPPAPTFIRSMASEARLNSTAPETAPSTMPLLAPMLLRIAISFALRSSCS